MTITDTYEKKRMYLQEKKGGMELTDYAEF